MLTLEYLNEIKYYLEFAVQNYTKKTTYLPICQRICVLYFKNKVRQDAVFVEKNEKKYSLRLKISIFAIQIIEKKTLEKLIGSDHYDEYYAEEEKMERESAEYTMNFIKRIGWLKE